MNFLKKIILVLIFLFPISNSFGTTITHNQTVSLETTNLIAGVAFNDDGTKVFTTYANTTNLNEYNLTHDLFGSIVNVFLRMFTKINSFRK